MYPGIGILFYLSAAQAAEPWMPDPLCADAPLASSTRVQGGVATGYVPPFRTADRTRSDLGLDTSFSPDPRTQLHLRWSWLWERTTAGEPTAGPGDVYLGTSVHLINHATHKAGLGWSVKLPNARDEGELGTDETDSAFGFYYAGHFGELSVLAGAGLAILGNPLRFANQDDLLVVDAEASWQAGWLQVAGVAHAEPRSDRNPARIYAGGRLVAGERWFTLLSTTAGLSPAAADLDILVGVGFRQQ